jgi:multidrug efflux system membrane fusion protein
MNTDGRTKAWVSKWAGIGILLCAAALVIYFGTARGAIPFLPQTSASRPAPVPVPVFATAVERRDVPVYLTGLGTVQAFNSVLVKSRVDGQIVRVNFTEGKEVRAGDVLVEIDPRPFAAALSQAQANKAKDEAQLANAQLDLERSSYLNTRSAGSKQQLDTARALVGQLEATVMADQAMIEMAQTQLDYSKIRSPIDGRAGTRLIDIGNIVRATDTGGIVIINQLHPIFVNFSLPAESLQQILTRSKAAEVKVTAQNSDLSDLAEGKLSVIDNQISTATGTIVYKAIFQNQEQVLWPGQFVNVRVEVNVRGDVLAVPVTAIQQSPDGPFVFIVSPSRVVQKRPVKVSLLTKTTAIIEDGLQQGDLVVTDGQYRIQSGTAVAVLANPTR